MHSKSATVMVNNRAQDHNPDKEKDSEIWYDMYMCLVTNVRNQQCLCPATTIP